MRETIGGTWLTQLVIVFMLVFVSFLALSINYSKAFRVKNETLSFIEKNEGITTSTITFINNYLNSTGYRTMGSCDEGSYGVSDLRNNQAFVTKAQKGKKYYYCVSKVKSKSTNFQNKAYYKVKLFFQFNLPIVGNVFTFDVDGQTKDVIYPADGTCSERDSIQCTK